MPERALGTEIYGLDLRLSGCELELLRFGERVIPAITLRQAEADRLGLELAMAHLWEWNQFVEIKRRAERRYTRYFRSWILMALAAVAAHTGYPGYWLSLLIALASCVLWRWTKFREDQGIRAAQEERDNFFPDWTYLRRRFDEDPMVAVGGPYPPPGIG
jgi:hypothetical protein